MQAAVKRSASVKHFSHPPAHCPDTHTLWELNRDLSSYSVRVGWGRMRGIQGWLGLPELVRTLCPPKPQHQGNYIL